MISFFCSHCGMKLTVKPEFAGRSCRCVTCKQPLVVPALDRTEASMPAGQIDGTESSLAKAGVEGGVTLEQAFPTSRANQKSVQELLAHRPKLTGRYIVEREIARGGMGAVVRAVDCDIRREVAVKYLLDQTNAGKKLRFVEEAQITGQLEHPNIVPIHELGVDNQKRLFFAMKLVKGRSLAQVMDELRQHPKTAEKEYSLGKLLNILVNVCNALGYAHSCGVVHRDLKPANIMIGDFGEVYVMDWGLAKVLKGGRANSEARQEVSAVPPSQPISSIRSGKLATSREPEADLTQEGAVLGTPVYMPPEQATGHVQDIDQRSDVYSLGAILYEMLTLQAPIDKEGGYLAILMRVMQGEIVVPEQRNPQRARTGRIPKELSAIAMKALARHPQQRYQAVEALRKDIERFQEGRSVSAKEDTKREMLVKFVKRNKAFSAATFTGLIVVALVLAAYLREQAKRTQQAKEAVPTFVRATRLLVNEREFKDALAQVNLALEYDPNHVECRLLKGQLLIVHQQFPAAQAELDEYLRLRPNEAGAKKLAEMCRKARPNDHATLLAFATEFSEQKSFRLADGMVQQFGASTAEARQELLLQYRKQIERAWPSLGNRLSMDLAGKYTLNLMDCGQVSDLTPLKGMPLVKLNLNNCVKVQDLTPLQGMPLESLSLESCGQVRDLTPLKNMSLTTLDLEECSQLRDLAPLQGIKLNSLNIRGCRLVSNLSPLQGMPLTELNLRGCNQLQDLAPLQGMKLTSLSLAACGQIRDLAPLKGMPLFSLDLWDCGQVRDLMPLKGMPLTVLSLFSCREVQDLAPLKDMKLTTLDIIRCSKVGDLTPLKDMKLTSLSLSGCAQVRDLTPLRSMMLTGLTIDECVQVQDLTPLTGLKLTSLGMAGCGHIRDLTPLRSLPLTTLDMRNCGRVDLSQLQGLRLNTLMLGNSLVQDLSPLQGMPLTTLDLRNGSEVRDLTPLQGMKLTTLMMDNCSQVRDLAPLKGMPLASITMFGCGQIRDLTPLQGMKLIDISLTPKNIAQGMEVLRQMPSLRTIGVGYDRRDMLAPDEFWKRYDAGEFKK